MKFRAGTHACLRRPYHNLSWKDNTEFDGEGYISGEYFDSFPPFYTSLIPTLHTSVSYAYKSIKRFGQ
jgi:hypothetical protein